ncbi:BPSS1780 family membrane protein [Hahella ganghwensis]|uniref:BPSS1780 family membrane protein n=1 Tax=Hahella ganghwensis TaxID=286420 RepID=UPI000366BB45|nr:BPSS1780 family membrane protein [Hahella ganghwensis]
MSTDNLYQAPASEVAEPPTSGELTEPQKRPVSDGWRWIADGFGLFKTGIGVWIGMIIVYSILIMIVAIIPLVNFFTALIVPIFMGGFMVAARNSDISGGPSFGDLFAGFKEQTGNLVLLGLIQLGMYVVLMIISFALMFIVGGSEMASTMDSMGDPTRAPAMGIGMALVFLVMLAIFIPLMMAIWFSPALVILNGLGPWTAFTTSFKGCLKNILPFLWYGIIAFILCIIASIPIFLGFLVLGPVLTASMYTGYKAIFLEH